MTSLPLTLRLRGVRDNLQPALGRIADIILESPERAATMNITELATAASCSEATVVRFARELGYRGYRDLRVQIHKEVWAGQQRAGDTGDHGDIDPGDDLATMTAKIANADTRAVQDSVRGLDLDVLADIADRVVAARRIMTFGVGASGLAAMDLEQKLTRIGLAATVHTEAHSGLTTAALLERGDVALVVSHSGRTADSVDIATAASQAGAHVVALTGSVGSPLSQIAEETLFANAAESALRSGAMASRIAQLTVIDCLFVAVATRLPDLGRKALRRTRAAVEDRRLR